VHLVGFIIRIYHNARSSERQKCLPVPEFFHSSLGKQLKNKVKLLSSPHFPFITHAVGPGPYGIHAQTDTLN